MEVGRGFGACGSPTPPCGIFSQCRGSGRSQGQGDQDTELRWRARGARPGTARAGVPSQLSQQHGRESGPSPGSATFQLSVSWAGGWPLQAYFLSCEAGVRQYPYPLGGATGLTACKPSSAWGRRSMDLAVLTVGVL